jgi:hypothetical protein
MDAVGHYLIAIQIRGSVGFHGFVMAGKINSAMWKYSCKDEVK